MTDRLVSSEFVEIPLTGNPIEGWDAVELHLRGSHPQQKAFISTHAAISLIRYNVDDNMFEVEVTKPEGMPKFSYSASTAKAAAEGLGSIVKDHIENMHKDNK